MGYSWAGAKKHGRAFKKRSYLWFLKDRNRSGTRPNMTYQNLERETWGPGTRKMFKKAKSRRERYNYGPIV